LKVCTECGGTKSISEFYFACKKSGKLKDRCRSCCKGYNKAWRKKNREYVKEYNSEWRTGNPEYLKEWRKANPQKQKDYDQKYYWDNPEKAREEAREWGYRNKDKVNANSMKRYASKKKAAPSWLSKEQKEEIVSFYTESLYLTKETGVPHEVDHIVPLRGKEVCGLHVPWNLQVLTTTENRKKSNKIKEF